MLDVLQSFAAGETGETARLSGLIFAAALIYSSVGHAGASGYIAAMALFGLAPSVMKSTALTLNILVATLGTVRWHRMGLVNWKAMLPLLVSSIPCAFIGGAVQLPSVWYRLLVGVILLIAATKLIFRPQQAGTTEARQTNIPWLGGVITGSGVGLLSGLTGTGGGIFLTPVLLFLGWAAPRQASGLTAPFILVNSIAGLAGNLLVLKALPAELPYFMVAAVAGGIEERLALRRHLLEQIVRGRVRPAAPTP